MDDNAIVVENCHTCFKDDSKMSVVSIMLGMTVCFSTLWRFPYQLVNFGGAAYLVVYMVLAALFVYPALTAEWGLGRLTGRGMDKAYKNVNFPGKKVVPGFLFLIVLVIGSYFIVWIGWIVRYAFSAVTDTTLSLASTNSEQYFNTSVVNQPILQWVFSLVVLALVAPTILGGNLRIQTISNKVVPIFYVAVILLTGLVLVQPGVASTTFAFFTTIDVAAITSYTFVTALGQAFFSLCLGGSFMVLYGSYMTKQKNHNIPLNAGYTIFGNALASVISAVLIIGVLTFAGIGNASTFGPGLFFGVIPEAFQLLGASAGTTVVGLLMFVFFALFFFAAYLPMTAILEVTTVSLVDAFGLTRRKAFTLVGVLTMILSVPSILSPLDGGFLYNLDLFVGAMGLIIGSFLAIMAFMWFVPEKVILEEVNAESRFKLGKKWMFWTKYVTPMFLLTVILYVLSDVVFNGASQLNGLADSDYVLYAPIVQYTPYIALILALASGVLYQATKKKSGSKPISA